MIWQAALGGGLCLRLFRLGWRRWRIDGPAGTAEDGWLGCIGA